MGIRCKVWFFPEFCHPLDSVSAVPSASIFHVVALSIMDQFLHHLLCLFHCQIPQTGVAFLRALLLWLLQCLLLFLHTLHGCSLFCCGSSRLLLSFFVLVNSFFAFNVDAFVAFYADAFVAFIVAFVVAFVAGDAAFFVVTGDTFDFVFFSSALCFSFLFFAAEAACFARLAVVTAASLSFVSSCLSLALCLFVKVFFAVAIVNCSLLFALCSLQKNEFKVSKIGLCKDAISSMTMDVFTVSTSSLLGRGWKRSECDFWRKFCDCWLSCLVFGLVHQFFQSQCTTGAPVHTISHGYQHQWKTSFDFHTQHTVQNCESKALLGNTNCWHICRLRQRTELDPNWNQFKIDDANQMRHNFQEHLSAVIVWQIVKGDVGAVAPPDEHADGHCLMMFITDPHHCEERQGLVVKGRHLNPVQQACFLVHWKQSCDHSFRKSCSFGAYVDGKDFGGKTVTKGMQQAGSKEIASKNGQKEGSWLCCWRNNQKRSFGTTWLWSNEERVWKDTGSKAFEWKRTTKMINWIQNPIQHLILWAWKAPIAVILWGKIAWQKDLEQVKKLSGVIIERAIESPFDLNVALKLSNGVNHPLLQLKMCWTEIATHWLKICFHTQCCWGSARGMEIPNSME